MPRVHEQDGFTWYIFVDDHDPPHVHVRTGDGVIIIEITPTVIVKRLQGKVKASDTRKALRLTELHLTKLLQAWNDIHGA
jgi:hypothetical protein